MIAIAEGLAAQHGMSLYAPEVNIPQEEKRSPPVEPTPEERPIITSRRRKYKAD
jgi:hypothetical protein